MTARTLLVDYGEVISHPQKAAAVAAMAATAGLDPLVFRQRYWQHRPAYDRGCPARTYWSAVLRRDLTSHDPVLDELVTQDLASWIELNTDTLEVLADAHQQGARLSLLSNAPHELADAVSAHPAFAIFEHLIFSARLGITKPDPAVFHAAVRVMGKRASVVFIDDRPENVAAAAAAGLGAVLFTSAGQLRSELSQ